MPTLNRHRVVVTQMHELNQNARMTDSAERVEDPLYRAHPLIGAREAYQGELHVSATQPFCFAPETDPSTSAISIMLITSATQIWTSAGRQMCGYCQDRSIQ